MTQEDLDLYNQQIEDAESEEQRAEIERIWAPKFRLCHVHMANRIKELDKTCVRKEDFDKGIERIEGKIEKLHTLPRFKDSPVEWVKNNWMWMCALLIVLKAMDLTEALERLIHIFGE